MPKVVDLNKGASVKPDAVAASAPTVRDESRDAGAPGIVDGKPAGAPAPALQPIKSNVPAFLKQFSAPALTGQQTGTGYVGFASDSSANWPSMQAAGLENGEPFVHHNGAYVKLPNSTLHYFLVACESFKSVMDSGGTFLYATRNLKVDRVTLKLPTGKARTFDSAPGGIQEHYTAYLFALVGSEVMPLRADFIGTKAGGIMSAVSALRAAADPQSGWSDLSDAHKVATQFPHPFGRVMCAMRTVPKLGKSSGNTYFRALCAPRPSTITEMEILVRNLSSTAFNEAAEAAHKSYLDRVKFLDTLAHTVRASVVEEVEQQAPAA